jgi:hypothetical protein
VQLPEIAVVEKSADHVRRDLLGADRVKLVSGRELEPSVSADPRSLEASMEKAVSDSMTTTPNGAAGWR